MPKVERRFDPIIDGITAVALSVIGTIFVDIVTVKAISFVAILAIAIVGGLIPLLSAKSTNSERFFSLGNAFAGGLFLGVGFIHLLPEGMEMLSAYSEFPWGAVTATAGFGVLLLLDRILFPEYQVSDSLRNSGTESIYPYVLLAMLSIHSIVCRYCTWTGGASRGCRNVAYRNCVPQRTGRVRINPQHSYGRH